MEAEEIEKYLIERRVRQTANRILVVRELMSTTLPVNLADQCLNHSDLYSDYYIGIGCYIFKRDHHNI